MSLELYPVILFALFSLTNSTVLSCMPLPTSCNQVPASVTSSDIAVLVSDTDSPILDSLLFSLATKSLSNSASPSRALPTVSTP